MDKYSYISNAFTGVIDDLYETYKSDPNSVDVGWQKFFEGFDFAQHFNDSLPENISKAVDGAPQFENLDKEFRVMAFINGWRQRGHLKSDTNPVRPRKDRKPQLDILDFGLTDADFSMKFAAGQEIGLPNGTLRQIQDKLQKIYASKIGFEFRFIRESEVQSWILNKIENEYPDYLPSVEEKKRILYKLNEAVVFENFLHTKYLGQKRFSLEGGETTISALDAIITQSADLGTEEVIIGMAHRGRLNVLANIMQKTYEQLFTEFEGTYIPDLTMGDGDVKYHMGFSSDVKTVNGKTVHLKLTPNPSHLEAVNSSVMGFARAKLDAAYKGDYKKVLPILIHGDASIAGQGVVYELIQMAGLEGYGVGGIIHFVINNQVGFTTDFVDARSSIYCTDVARLIDSPIFHVNGDSPEDVHFAVKLAVEYRQTFGKDVFIDMVCYRRHGHNESDEPKFTQPTLYNLIARHPNPREVYNKTLIDRGVVDAALAEGMDKEFRNLLQDRLNQIKQQNLPYKYQKLENEWRELRRSQVGDFDKSPDTAISEEVLNKVGLALTTIPDHFKPLKQIEKLLKDRYEMFFETKILNWASAELLAYGSMLAENKRVRISGQDVRRGTFSHRHAVLNDANTNEPYNSLDAARLGEKPMQIYNSLLSEYAVLGFEFGYAMANPNAMVIWEAQFGDFANGAQVMIDQFISSSESKWQRMNGVVLLLPHGYEGQGPEHSSARLERFLQLSGEYNMVVANVTTPANFFHLLRRQLAWPFRKPLIVMSPKSMLRHPAMVSPTSEFTSGKFQEIFADKYATAKTAKTVLMCSGKIYFELLEKQQAEKRKDVAIVRFEQLFPFPKKQVEKLLEDYKKARFIWVQEEPENMGAWGFILRHLRQVGIDVIARKESASPATGYMKVHTKEQSEIIEKAFSTNDK